MTFCSLTDGLGLQVVTGNPNVSADRMRAMLGSFVERELLARGDQSA